MSRIKQSLLETPLVSADDNEIYDESTGNTIAEILDGGIVVFGDFLTNEEKERYKHAILANRRLCKLWYITPDSFIDSYPAMNESKTFDPKNNKQHKEAYNSFVKWYNRWKEKLGREEIRALVKKVSNDALGDNLDTINN